MSFFFSNPFDELVGKLSAALFIVFIQQVICNAMKQYISHGLNLEKATSENLPIGADVSGLAFEIADKIKAKEITAKLALASIKRRINHKNPNVQILALNLTDICIKNGGQHFLVEVASKDFVDNLAGIIRANFGLNSDLRQKALYYLQTWGLTFKSNPSLCYMTTPLVLINKKGTIFPPLDEAVTSAAMIDTTTAPEWSDSDVCTRCRTKFTTFNRKHHCRNCGQTFCNDCSSKKASLPHVGITEDVRVCDGCHIKLFNKSFGEDTVSARPKSSENYSKQEEEELERAIAASLETADISASKSKSKKGKSKKSKKQVSFKEDTAEEDEEDDPDLRSAIEASLRESQNAAKKKESESAPLYPLAQTVTTDIYNEQKEYPKLDVEVTANPNLKVKTMSVELLSAREIENLRLFAELIERTDADMALRGIQNLNATQLQNAYNSIAALQPKLVSALRDIESKRLFYEDLNGKLSEAVKSYEKFLQDRIGTKSSVSQSYYGYQPQTYQPPYASETVSTSNYYSDHGYAVPPTPVQSSYGEFYHHKISENASSNPAYGHEYAVQNVNPSVPSGTKDSQHYSYYPSQNDSKQYQEPNYPEYYPQSSYQTKQGTDPGYAHPSQMYPPSQPANTSQPQHQQNTQQSAPPEEKPLIEF